MLANRISLFTTALRTEFVTAYEDSAVPAEYENYTTVIPSGGRFENYPWLGPTPGIDLYEGHRRVGVIPTDVYTVENLEYDVSFQVLLRDLKDDQVGGFMLKAKELANKARKFPGRAVLKHASLGKTKKCFDKSSFFANSHNYGTVDNLMSYNPSANDSVVHNIMVFCTVGPLKPLLWQQRSDIDLENDLDQKSSKFNKKGHFWCDLEGAAAFGRPHDAILMEISDTPTLTELQEILGLIEDQFRTFRLPTGLDTDTPEYIHEQLVFTKDTITVVCSTNLANKMRQVLSLPLIVQSGAAINNLYAGWGNLVVSGLINTVS
jgi:phage major head subunit gpT-like protein